MNAQEQIKLDALNYCQKNRRPISSIKDFVTGYEKCADDFLKMDFEQFKKTTEMIFEQLDKKILNQFYDPELTGIRRKQLEHKQDVLNHLLKSIQNAKI